MLEWFGQKTPWCWGDLAKRLLGARAESPPRSLLAKSLQHQRVFWPNHPQTFKGYFPRIKKHQGVFCPYHCRCNFDIPAPSNIPHFQVRPRGWKFYLSSNFQTKWSGLWWKTRPLLGYTSCNALTFGSKTLKGITPSHNVHERLIFWPLKFVCDGTVDCENGADEAECVDYLAMFRQEKGFKVWLVTQIKWHILWLFVCNKHTFLQWSKKLPDGVSDQTWVCSCKVKTLSRTRLQMPPSVLGPAFRPKTALAPPLPTKPRRRGVSSLTGRKAFNFNPNRLFSR